MVSTVLLQSLGSRGIFEFDLIFGYRLMLLSKASSANENRQFLYNLAQSWMI